MATIYIIKNSVNDKCYVGQCCCSVESRFRTHIHDSNRTIPLHADIDKYGADKFYFEVLDTCEDDIRLDVETYYIDKLNTLIPNGYNVYRHSSDGFSNKRHTKQAIDKISNSSKEWWKNADVEIIQRRNKKISDRLTGRQFSEEHKRKISEQAKKRTGEKNPFYGKRHSEETRNKIRLKNSHRVYFRLDKDERVLQQYNTIEDVYCWIIEQGLTTASKTSIKYRIYATVEGRQQSAYGYKWSCRECNDYPIGGESPQ